MFLEKLLKFRKTLSFRLTIWYAGIFTLSSFLAFSVFYFRIHSVTMARVDEELTEEAEELSDALSEDGIAQVKVEIAEERLEMKSIVFDRRAFQMLFAVCHVGITGLLDAVVIALEPDRVEAGSFTHVIKHCSGGLQLRASRRVVGDAFVRKVDV